MIVMFIDGLSCCWLSPSLTPFLSKHLLGCMKNVQPVVTAPNWITLLSGLSPSQHKIFNNRPVKYSLHSQGITTLFDDFEQSTIVSDWKLFKSYFRGSNAQFLYVPINFWECVDALQLKQNELTLLNYQELDHVGHECGWGSKQYVQALVKLDQQISHFCSLHIKQPIVIVADHGGKPGLKNHDCHVEKCCRWVPLIGIGISEKHLKYVPIPRSTMQFRKWLKSI